MLKALTTFLTLILLSHFAQAGEIPFLKPYAGLLNDYVSETTLEGIPTTAINYKAWQKDPRHKKAVEMLTNDSIGAYSSKEDQLSFWINAYNLLVIDLIVREVPEKSIQDLGGIVGDPWNEYNWLIDGLEYNLSYIQHQILKPQGEVRANFALTCGAISCPSLKKTPYWQDKIYTQLENQTKKFIANESKAIKRIKTEAKANRIKTPDKLFISELFLWHQQDFENGNVKRFLQRYINTPNTEIEDYIEFNWNLNAKADELPNPKLRNPINTSKKDSAKAFYE